MIFTSFGMIFTHFESDFHSVRVVLALFTLLKSNHFTLFTLREWFQGNSTLYMGNIQPVVTP